MSSAPDCQLPTPTFQNLKSEQTFGFTDSTITDVSMRKDHVNSSVARRNKFYVDPYFAQISTKKAISEKLGLRIGNLYLESFLQFLSERVGFKGQLTTFLESWSLLIDTKMSPQLSKSLYRHMYDL